MTTNQAQRPRFYEGQYLGSRDLTAAVDYARVLAARHALGAHTWGIGIGLGLREVPKPGGPTNQVDVFLQPGYACDGFGRTITVLAPYKIPEVLFDAIQYDPIADAAGVGRPVQIWICYREIGVSNPSPGFEVCDTPDQSARIQETFQVLVGRRVAHIDRHDPLIVAGKSVDAQQALKLFDPNASQIYDESIPHQTFPDSATKAEWLIPLGYVRWLPAPNGPGSFVAFTSVSDDAEKNENKAKTRAFRHYMGVVVDAIEAADGAIRLRDRTKDPSNSSFHSPADELVNVEGHLRVEGDARLVNGALDFRASDGTDQGTPLRIQRSGDTGSPDGKRALQVVIGPASQTDNRFAVGPLVVGLVDEKFTVLSSGNVGISAPNPTNKLHVDGVSGIRQNRLYLSGKEGWSSLSYNAFHNDANSDWVFPDPSRSAVSIELDDRNSGCRFEVFTKLTPNPSNWKSRLKISGDTGNVLMAHDGGKVGIGTGNPVGRLTLDGELPGHGLLSFFTPSADIEYNGGSDGLFIFQDNGGKTAFMGGKVGIGTTNPVGRLTLNGIAQPQQGALSFFTQNADMEYDGGNDHLFVFRDNGGKTAFMGGNLGIGTINPECKLHVTDSLAANASFLNAHVAVIENTSTSTDADVLALKLGAVNPAGGNNYITFFGGNGALASFEGNGSGDVTYHSGGADYAESLPCLDESETFEAGDVVGVVNGKITRHTSGAQHVSVITDRPVVVGNSPPQGERQQRRDVSFVGQVGVRVRGPVKAGDYIIPSGSDDGLGLALPAEKLSLEQAGQIVGQAWESALGRDVKRVLTAVGLPTTSGAILHVLGEQIKSLQQELISIKQ